MDVSSLLLLKDAWTIEDGSFYLKGLMGGECLRHFEELKRVSATLLKRESSLAFLQFFERPPGGVFF